MCVPNSSNPKPPPLVPPPPQVRLLADLLLCRLSFRSLAAHLEPVCAAFGAGASAACVVDVAAGGTSLACVEEGLLLTDAGATRLRAGADAASRALLALLRAHGGWPEALSAAGGGGAGGGAPAGGGGGGGSGAAYDFDLVARLRDSRCYCVKVTDFSLGSLYDQMQLAIVAITNVTGGWGNLHASVGTTPGHPLGTPMHALPAQQGRQHAAAASRWPGSACRPPLRVPTPTSAATPWHTPRAARNDHLLWPRARGRPRVASPGQHAPTCAPVPPLSPPASHKRWRHPHAGPHCRHHPKPPSRPPPPTAHAALALHLFKPPASPTPRPCRRAPTPVSWALLQDKGHGSPPAPLCNRPPPSQATSAGVMLTPARTAPPQGRTSE
mgnify:CR=1 FL=1